MYRSFAVSRAVNSPEGCQRVLNQILGVIADAHQADDATWSSAQPTVRVVEMGEDWTLLVVIYEAAGDLFPQAPI